MSIMNDKQTAMMTELLEGYAEKYHVILTDLAELAISLGYKPTRNKTQNVSLDFKNSKNKETIMKMEQIAQKQGSVKIEDAAPGLRLRFFATKEYPEVFRNSVKRVIEDFGGKYTGCYGCGRCNGNPQGYVYTYEDGKKVFRCGRELIGVYGYETCELAELEDIIRNQAKYYDEYYAQKAQ